MRFFNRIRLLTPESVELEFTLAGIGNRAYALVFDYFIWSFMLIGVLLAWYFASIYMPNIVEIWASNKSKIELWMKAIQLLIFFFIYVGYFVFFEVLWQGQTPGKRFVKIRVICEDGRPIGLQQATLRALLRPVDDIFFMGLFLIVLGKREKRLGDWVAGTVVIQEEQPIAATTFFLSDKAQTLAKELLKTANMSLLLPDDFAVIREYLQRRGQMTPQAKADLSRQLGRQLKKAIALEKVPAGVTADLFLEAVYLAYQQQSSSV